MPKGLFRGGIHPPENKERTATLRTVVAQRPSKVAVLLHQGSNCPLTPTVAKGDHVRMGQKVADTEEKWGVPAHSPVSGKIDSIGLVRTASGAQDQAIFIVPDEEDVLDESCVPVDNVFSRPPEELIAMIREAGIVGMGGAEFPTHIKLSLPPKVEVDTLLLNGAECEPYLTADHRLMVERPRDIIRGAQILMRAIGVMRTRIGIEDNKPDAIHAMRDAAVSAAGIEVVPVKTRYPQGSEKHLIKSVLGREVPPGCLPFSVGVVVSNVGTAAAVADRFDRGLPLIERIVTVTGSAVASPANLIAKIGTPASELIEACGGFVGEPGKIIFGGPMMGMAVPSADVPTGRGTSGILVMSREESAVFEEMPCIKCGQCVDACPMRLEPAFLHQWSEAGLWDEAEAYHAMDCIECGVCTYVCPSRRNLVQAIKRAKFEISARRRAARERGGK
ncbi:MAG: electron transport complex subunit RsxC [Bacillota bacterium]|jgi:electron transport complex protein RnfC|nr:electron transport complex subunit RsxC [Bacillota bacterium]HAN87409.1 electron transport complex subunit RsxC [Bacillota bacterium]